MDSTPSLSVVGKEDLEDKYKEPNTKYRTLRGLEACLKGDVKEERKGLCGRRDEPKKIPIFAVT